MRAVCNHNKSGQKERWYSMNYSVLCWVATRDKVRDRHRLWQMREQKETETIRERMFYLPDVITCVSSAQCQCFIFKYHSYRSQLQNFKRFQYINRYGRFFSTFRSVTSLNKAVTSCNTWFQASEFNYYLILTSKLHVVSLEDIFEALKHKKAKIYDSDLCSSISS